jgi:hypothetical protein
MVATATKIGRVPSTLIAEILAAGAPLLASRAGMSLLWLQPSASGESQVVVPAPSDQGGWR